jgi:hypothetical protein
MRNMLTWKWVLPMIALVFVAGCGPSKAELAKKEAAARVEQAKAVAMKAFSEVRSETIPGALAEEKAGVILQALSGANLGYDVIGSTHEEVMSYVRKAYGRDVSFGLAKLAATHGNARAARDLKAWVLKSAELAGRPLRDFDTSEARLDQSVQRNLLEEVKATGRPVPLAMYKAAGLPPNEVKVTKYVRVRVPVPVPAKKPATRRGRAARR